VLDRFLIGPAVDAVADTLRAAPSGPVAVVGQPRLARALAERGVAVLAVGGEQRALKKLKGAAPARAREDALPVGDRALSALVGWGAGARADWAEVLAEWSRAVIDGGLLVMVDRAAPTELSRRALCSGLAELQQRPAGRLVVTSGIVTDL
jgi:hypothetical protein